MIAWLIRRLLVATGVTIVVIVLVFLLVNAVGDPAVATLGPNAGPEQIEDFKRKNGLDEPVHRQLLSYVGLIPCVRNASPAAAEGRHCGLLQGDFGESFSHNESVATVISHRLPRTLLLGAVAMIFELLFGLGVGILAAVRRNTWIDTGLMAVAFLGISLPTFVTGPLFLSWFGFRYGWFPLGGYGVDFWDHVYHSILPAFTLAIIGAATYARVMRGELVETLRSDFVRTAAAKGLPPRRVVGHAVRNALLPVVTLFGLSLPLLVAGAIITEKIFGWPGMGSLAIESIVNLDAPTVMGVVVVFAVAVQVGNLFADFAVALLDPRVRVEKSG
ncbi:MAG: ABC transporter permease [Sandaracinus sp.]|nr:ABC transporter permease [Myxococcales bacterium]MCB9612547.1 ABC transporter permease [Sandaracinus sp.]MCB9623444.1 ABC transporter permease [Sandaracinus sp.]